MTPSSILITLLEELTHIPGKQLLMFTNLLKDMLKDTDKQPRRDTEGEVWEGPKYRSFCSYEIGVHHPLSTWMCSPTLKLPKLYTIGIFMEASSYKHDYLLTPFPTPRPTLENGGGAKNIKLLILALSFWCPALIQEPSKNHPAKFSLVKQQMFLVLLPFREL